MTEDDVRRIVRDEVALQLAADHTRMTDDQLLRLLLSALGFQFGDEAQEPDQQQPIGDSVAPVEVQVLSEALDLLCANGLLRQRDVAQAHGGRHETSPSVGVSGTPTVGERPVAGDGSAPATEPAEGGDR